MYCRRKDRVDRDKVQYGPVGPAYPVRKDRVDTVPPNVYLYYYICYYTTDVTTWVVSLTLLVVKMYVCI